tara:strand:- start:1122 stop:1793 length:672 start_codon:yes stop_codon:yes gene_type:complete
MHQQKGKKILAYFFILLAFGSINNIELKNSSFYKIKNIKISGFNEEETKILIKKINKLNLQNIFLLNYNELNKLFNSNSLIETYKIDKKYPSTLDIKIKKTKFLANINIDNQPYLIGSNGKLIQNNSFNPQLPYVFGKPDINEFLEFKKIIDQSQFSYNEIEKLYFFPSKRWDVKLKKDVLIKLPKNNIKKSLENSYELLKDTTFQNVKVIDARVINQIILND